MSKRAAILARISDADDDETAGVDDQVKDMRGHVARQGWTLEERHVLVENDTSAFKRKKIRLPNGRYALRTVRPKFRRALELLEMREVDVLVVPDIDRLARQPRDLEDLIDVIEMSHFAVTCVSLTGSAQLTDGNGIAMARIMCAVANKASADTARRVARARLRQAEEGRFGGGRRPYGFAADGTTPIPSEYAVIRRMADVVLLPNFGEPNGPSLASIARELQEVGTPTADGGQWTAPAVRDVIMRPRNAGLMVNKPGQGRKVYTPADVVGRAPWEPIIAEEELWAIIGKLSDPSRRTNTAGVAPKHFLSGIAMCPCGLPVRVSGTSRRKDRPIYTCQATNRTQGTHATCPQAELDMFVEEVAAAILARDAGDLIKPSQGTADAGRLRGQLAALRESKAQLGEDHDMGLVDRAEYLRRAKKLNTKIEDLERELREITEATAGALAPFAGVESQEQALQVLRSLGLTRQREVIKSIMTVTLKPVGRGRRPAIPDRVTIDPITMR